MPDHPPPRVSREDLRQITVSVQRLRSRVLDDDLRAAVGDFVSRCARYGLGPLGYPKGKVPDDEKVSRD